MHKTVAENCETCGAPAVFFHREKEVINHGCAEHAGPGWDRIDGIKYAANKTAADVLANTAEARAHLASKGNEIGAGIRERLGLPKKP